MKKSYKIILIAFIILLVTVVSFVLKIDMGKTQYEIIDVLRQELQLSEDDGTMISCVGEYEIGESALLWFYFENQPLTYYRAVECRVVADGKYQVKDDNVITALQAIRRLGVEPMQNPFEYVSHIQKDFDYWNIPFSDEFYDITGIEKS